MIYQPITDLPLWLWFLVTSPVTLDHTVDNKIQCATIDTDYFHQRFRSARLGHHTSFQLLYSSFIGFTWMILTYFGHFKAFNGFYCMFLQEILTRSVNKKSVLYLSQDLYSVPSPQLSPWRFGGGFCPWLDVTRYPGYPVGNFGVDWLGNDAYSWMVWFVAVFVFLSFPLAWQPFSLFLMILKKPVPT